MKNQYLPKNRKISILSHFNEGVLSSVYKEKNDYRDKINLSSNEQDCKIFQSFKDEFFRNIPSHYITDYPYYPFYIKKFAIFFGIDESELLFSAGSDDAIKIILTLCCLKNKRMIIQSPNYYNYYYYAKILEIEIIEVKQSLNSLEDDFIKDFILKIKCISPSLIVITNPSGIKGNVLSLDKVEIILEIAEKKNHLVLIDEAYVGFNKFNHLKFIKKYKNIIIIRTLSKIPGLAGMRLGLIFTSKEINRFLKMFNICNGVSSITLEFWNKLIKKNNITKEIFDLTNQNKKYFIGNVKRIFPNCHCYDSKTNFVLIDFKYEIVADTVISHLFKNNIIVKKMTEFEGYSTCIRFTIKNKELIDKVISILNEIN